MKLKWYQLTLGSIIYISIILSEAFAIIAMMINVHNMDIEYKKNLDNYNSKYIESLGEISRLRIKYGEIPPYENETPMTATTFNTLTQDKIK